ncbi:uncharacterized protein LOC133881931 isoform X3 [Alnus glutinosa]|uniref:uncharacterized protein LOC133881931 isoform X3 n=1 Tax=Alnus glutinosa TaxID=3517 RepID=UPI002D79DC41|nr:uncharacterized protein LOC133881931 isoform X3 [Alnus glutinosa]
MDFRGKSPRGNFMQVTEQRIWDTTGAITGFLHRVHCKRIWLGAAATYMRFFPSIMKNYDYGQGVHQETPEELRPSQQKEVQEASKLQL